MGGKNENRPSPGISMGSKLAWWAQGLVGVACTADAVSAMTVILSPQTPFTTAEVELVKRGLMLVGFVAVAMLHRGIDLLSRPTRPQHVPPLKGTIDDGTLGQRPSQRIYFASSVSGYFGYPEKIKNLLIKQNTAGIVVNGMRMPLLTDEDRATLADFYLNPDKYKGS